MRKPSFFQKLTGAVSPDEYDDLFENEHPQHAAPSAVEPHDAQHLTPTDEDPLSHEQHVDHADHEPTEEEIVEEGELSVDIYQTNDSIVVKALVAGVNPSTIDISLTRDMITIRGNREEHTEVTQENYFYKELYWGAFTRTILLPEEVDVDAAEASTNHGILVIRLPKINKERKTKLKVKAGR